MKKRYSKLIKINRHKQILFKPHHNDVIKLISLKICNYNAYEWDITADYNDTSHHFNTRGDTLNFFDLYFPPRTKIFFKFDTKSDLFLSKTVGKITWEEIIE